MSLVVTAAIATAAVADAQPVKSKIAMATAALKHGLAMVIATTAHTSGMAFQSISTVTNSVMTAATAIKPANHF
jgi:tyrosine-protein phosphatase YwqE